MKKILLDTSVIIDFLRRKDKSDSLLSKLSNNDFYISIVTHTELFSGRSVWEKKEIKQELDKFLSIIVLLPLMEEISQAAGKIKAYDPKRSVLDCIIAATAIRHNLPLVTLNIKDFENIKGMRLYKE